MNKLQAIAFLKALAGYFDRAAQDSQEDMEIWAMATNKTSCENIAKLLADNVIGYVAANGNKDKFRIWVAEGPAWTDVKKDAVIFVRREDCEKVFAEDEDTWHILPVTAEDMT